MIWFDQRVSFCMAKLKDKVLAELENIDEVIKELPSHTKLPNL